MPPNRAKGQARPLTPAPPARPKRIDDTPIVEPKHAKKYGKINPDFAAMAGWRSGFDSPAHKAAVVRALREQSALCPKCGFDLINQRRPDCPECGLAIDPRTLVVQDAPPGPLLVRTLAAAVGLSWLAMIVGGFAWAGVTQALALTALFALQLAAGWALLTLCTDTTWYRGVSTPRRKLLLAASIAAATTAGVTAILAIAGFLS